MTDTHSNAAERAKPGELLRLVAEGLAADGFAIGLPENDGGCHITIDCHDARCAVSVSDWGDVEWEWCPWASGDADPKRTADAATALLTGCARGLPRLGGGYCRDGMTFKGMVGLELKARGFEVALEVCADEDYFDAQAAIVVTSPGSGADAAVFVDDDGRVIWTRDYWAEAATIVWEPVYSGWITDPGKVAGSVAATIAGAMSLIAPGETAMVKRDPA
ncbi:MAG TPA: hypothetical protein VNF47_14500 [Streptosporangiaceae bacterium]|nr:hypothetical protein [Streptosporangiaceae bacterium]